MKTYNAQERKSAATVVVGGKAKFPIKDKRHAKLALGEINSAKPPLTSSQKAAVRAKAARYGATPGAKPCKVCKGSHVPPHPHFK